MLRDVTPVILAGGHGTRLRPLTSLKRPKPFLKPFSRYSLLQETLLRGRNMAASVVITHKNYGAMAYQEMAALDMKGRVVCEPVYRCTAAAIALAAFSLEGENKPMLVMPSDHYMEDAGGFEKSVLSAVEILSEARIILFGAPASAPKPRYGYITSDGQGMVSGFVEKPDTHRAKILIESGGCFWNTGIFMMKPKCYLGFLKKFTPDIYKNVKMAFEAAEKTEFFLLANQNIYAKVESQAVDHAIMENVAGLQNAVKVVPLSSAWQDIGSWNALFSAKIRSLKNLNYIKRNKQYM